MDVFTATENIILGVKDDEGYSRAAAEARVKEITERYGFRLDPHKKIYEMSVSEKQTVEIIKVLYRNADILILDEPTASLDPLAEQEVFRRFDELRGEKTTVFVSHRLSSATIATKIVVLENGHVEEEGTHRELMNKNGKYAELFRIQAERYLEEAEAK